MRRRALIISASNVLGLPYLPGADYDGKHWWNYLQSPNGGAWDAKEVDVLPFPSLKMVKDKLASMAGVDYAFIAFSGHGDHVPTLTGGYDTVALADGEEISETELLPSSAKVALVLDSCRRERNPDRGGTPLQIKSASSVTPDSAYFRQCRELFDESLKGCAEGILRLKSCSVNQSAQEAPSGQGGGYFTDALILPFMGGQPLPFTWQAEQRVIGLMDAFDAAKIAVLMRNPNQTPMLEGDGLNNNFPFAVYP